ncbi:MAG TPA: acyltransferase [Roseiarcus sp.]|jgi:peptidoglycan/LPS O-acetylase OafA/YrhL
MNRFLALLTAAPSIGGASATNALEPSGRAFAAEKRKRGGQAPARFQALDSWRGVAAVLVVLYHGAFLGALNDNAFVRGGYLFVDFFFVLSGFVIAHAYGDKLGEPKAVLGFMIRRFGRLWPLHAVMLCAFAAAEALNTALHAQGGDAEAFRLSVNDNSFYSFVTNLVMLNAVGLHRSITWNGASWSIGAEFYTYLAFSAVMIFARRRARIASAVLALAGGLAVLAFSAHRPPMDATYDLGAARCLYGFFVGVILEAAFSRERVSALPYATTLEACVLAASAGFVALAGQGRLGLAAPLVFAPLVYVFAHQRGAISRLLAARPFAALGAWSYSIYMTQGLIGNAYDRAILMLDDRAGLWGLERLQIGGRDYWSAHANGWTIDALNLALIGAVVFASAFSFHWIEEPARKAFNRLADAAPSHLARFWRRKTVSIEADGGA